MPSFVLSSHQGGFSILGRHNSKNNLTVDDGEISENQMRAIAYKILSMIESDRVH